MKKIGPALLVYLLSFAVHAQKRIIHQQLVWTGFSVNMPISNGFSALFEADERRFIQNYRHHSSLWRVHVKYKYSNKFTLSMGFAQFWQSPNDPKSTSTLIVPELRPHAQADLDISLSNRISMNHRYRFEWRFFKNVYNGELTKGYHSNFRLRYKLGFDIRLFTFNTNELKLKAGDEIMLNAGKDIVHNVFDQNRIYLGLTYSWNERFSIECVYINWFQQQANGIDFYERDIFRLILNYTFLKQKK